MHFSFLPLKSHIERIISMLNKIAQLESRISVVLVALIWLLCCSQLLFSWMVLNIQSLGLHSWALSSIAEADHSAKPDCWLGLTRSFPM